MDFKYEIIRTLKIGATDKSERTVRPVRDVIETFKDLTSEFLNSPVWLAAIFDHEC